MVKCGTRSIVVAVLAVQVCTLLSLLTARGTGMNGFQACVVSPAPLSFEASCSGQTGTEPP